MNTNLEYSIVGLWEQAGLLDPDSGTPICWPEGTMNSKWRDFLCFLDDGTFIYARFPVEKEVKFNRSQKKFLNVKEAKEISLGKYQLNGNIMTQEYTNKEGELVKDLVTIGEISERHFTVEAEPPGAGFIVRAIYHKSVDSIEYAPPKQKARIKLIDPWDYILPLILPYDWYGTDQVTHRSLCFLPEKEGTPWVVYYYKVGYWTVYEGEENDPIEIEQKASENLSKIPMKWQTLEFFARKGGRVKGLICTQEAQATERILDRKNLREAHSILKAKELAAAIPHRGSLFVTDRKYALDLLDFAATHYYNFNNELCLTPWVFYIVDGVVRGMYFDRDGKIEIEHNTLPPEYEQNPQI